MENKDKKIEKKKTTSRKTPAKKKTTKSSNLNEKKITSKTSRKRTIKKENIKKENIKKESNKVNILLQAIFFILLIVVVVLGILVVKKDNENKNKVVANIVVPVFEKDNQSSITINADALTSDYIVKVTNYKSIDNVNKEEFTYDVSIQNNTSANVIVKKGKNGLPRIYTKTYLNAKIQKDEIGGYKIITEERTKPVSSIEFIESKYSNDNAKKDLVKLFNNSRFDYPKPIELIKTLIKIYNNKNAIILDFFAGSGTTGQAVVELNSEDNGNRQFILCTNNENNICEEVTYQRLIKVNYGTTKAKPLKFNLKYYRTSYIPRINTEEENIQERKRIKCS